MLTNEQWLVYLWSIYPQGGVSVFWFISFCISLVIVLILWIGYSGTDIGKRDSTQFVKMGKYKIFIPLFFMLMLFLSQLVPSRNNFMFIVATPYIVENGKSIVDSLQDPTSKAYKLNQLMDKGLDKMIIALDKNIADKPGVIK